MCQLRDKDLLNPSSGEEGEEGEEGGGTVQGEGEGGIWVKKGSFLLFHWCPY